jgi:probable HAF family extracellular repeat protein
MNIRSLIQNASASLLSFVTAMALTPEAGAGSAVPVPAAYSIVDLGTLGGTFTLAIGINNSGQVTGLATTAGDAAVHTFLWQNGKMTDVGSLGGDFSEAALINDLGQAAGDSFTSGGEHHLATWSLQNGSVKITDRGILPGATDMYGQGINDSGQLVGEADFADGTAHTILADKTGIHDLHNLVSLGGASDAAFAISGSGQIIGESDTAGPDSHAFLLDKAGLHDLASPMGTWSEAFAINTSGQVSGNVGWDPDQHASYRNFNFGSGIIISTPGFHNRAFIYSGGVVHPLEPLPGFTESAGPWLDDLGRVFGTSSDADRTSFSPTMWVNGKAISINSLLVNPPAGASLKEVVWGNSQGQLTGYGDSANGEFHSYLLTPVAANAR